MFEELIAKMAGKYIAKKANLQEGELMDTKRWFQSRTVWISIVTGILGIYLSIPGLPPIPEWVFALLGGLGVYTRVTTTKTIV